MDEEVRPIFSDLLGRRIEDAAAIGGGRNSRVYRLRTGEGTLFAGKIYHRTAHDKRDRLGTEFRALGFLRDHGIAEVPVPVAADPAQGAAVYEFVSGAVPEPDDIGPHDLARLLDFVRKLQELGPAGREFGFSAASEAMFCPAQAAENIRARLDPLRRVKDRPKLAAFLDKDFEPLLARAIETAREKCGEAGIGLDRPVPEAQRILSPSDFGFHNSLRREDGRLRFVDFEYFGWDDPAKMICDFLLHPAMQGLDERIREDFLSGALLLFRDRPGLGARLEALFPLVGLKWCLILLNEFLAPALSRRAHAKGRGFNPGELSDKRAAQLDKAAAMLGKVKNELKTPSYRFRD